jgi:signal transduction histidine kinase
MSRINQDLQASHKIISIVEKSKNYSESLIDNLPDVFAVINDQFEILRSSHVVNSLLSCNNDDVFRQKINKVFRKESWDIFLHNIKRLKSQKLSSLEFELPIQHTNERYERSYFWHISLFNLLNTKEGELYTIIGRDISQLRESERKMLEVFTSIPLGLITVEESGIIGPRYSAYSKFLLEKESIEDLDFYECIFKPAENFLAGLEIKALATLKGSLGQSELMFEAIKNVLPKMIKINVTNNDHGFRHLSVTYQPVVYEKKIRSILFILEDKTDTILSEEVRQKMKLMEDKTINLILQIKRADAKILSMVMYEIDHLFKKINTTNLVDSTFREELARTIHSITGNARVLGFVQFCELAFTIENKIKKSDIYQLGHTDLNVLLKSLSDEWNEILSIYEGLHKDRNISTKSEIEAGKSKELVELIQKYNKLLAEGVNPSNILMAERILLAIQNLSYKSTNEIFAIAKIQCNDIAKKLNKEANFNISSQEVKLDKESYHVLSECFLHLTSNAIDHGIEKTEERKALGKPEIGNINISLEETKGVFYIKFSDDGRGINIDKIKSQLLKRRIYSLDKIIELSDQEILNYIFESEFSTKDQADEISGRGLALSTVQSLLSKHAGNIKVDSEKGKGTTFHFYFKGQKNSTVEKSFNSFASFMSTMRSHFLGMAFENKQKVIFKDLFRDETSPTGILYIDAFKVSLTITTAVMLYGCNHEVVELSSYIAGDHQVGMNIKFSKPRNQSNLSADEISAFQSTLETGLSYIQLHRGIFIADKDELIFKFEHLLKQDSLPTLHYFYEEVENLDLISDNPLVETLKEHAMEFDVTLEEVESENKADIIFVNNITAPEYRSSKLYFPINMSGKILKREILVYLEKTFTS